MKKDHPQISCLADSQRKQQNPNHADADGKNTFSLSKVESYDWSYISPDKIDDRDVYYYFQPHQWAADLGHSLAYYLGHFHRLANAVRLTEPNRGFIDLPVWRKSPFKYYNARIMENILSLAWFYSREASWNPYYADEALRLRLEAAIWRWIGMQSDDGRFSEYREEGWNLPATAFAAKFMAEAVLLLKDGPPLDQKLYDKVQKSLRQAIMITLESQALWEKGRNCTNQYTSIFAAALAYLHMCDDEEMEEVLERQMRAAVSDFVSPAGYLYEHAGPDWGYYLGTDHSNGQMIWHYGRKRKLKQRWENDEATTFGDLQKEEYRQTAEWLSYNAVPQPDGETFILNRALETRQKVAGFNRIETPLAEVVPGARAFSVTDEERRQRLEWCRRQLESDWGDPPALETGEHMGFSPYAFLHRNHRVWNPSQKQRQQAQNQLPYMADQCFVHQRVDNLQGTQIFTYIRRPAYYAAFNDVAYVGNNSKPISRPSGIGLVWHPQHGALIQSHSKSEQFAWGAYNIKESSLYEGGSLDVNYLVDGSSIQPRTGTKNLGDGEIQIYYPMNHGQRRLHFNQHDIHIAVTDYVQRFVERIPLLLTEDDKLEISKDACQTVHMNRLGRCILTIAFTGAEEITVREAEEPLNIFGNGGQTLKLAALHVTAAHNLSYELKFHNAAGI